MLGEDHSGEQVAHRIGNCWRGGAAGWVLVARGYRPADGYWSLAFGRIDGAYRAEGDGSIAGVGVRQASV
jgi:hypothetical protein